MKILYVASGIPVPGTLGGSTHAYEVARGLAQRGHTLHLVAASRTGWAGFTPFVRPNASLLAGFHLHQQDVPKAVAFAGLWPILRLARTLRPDVIIERYYNFAGAGIWAAHQLGIPALLEVNALIVDPPTVFKRRLDDALGGPLRRWAELQCQWANRIITPLHTTVPASIARAKVVELPWGADTDRFAAVAAARRQTPPHKLPVVLFLGSFRAWHGVLGFMRAAVRLLATGQACRFLLVGDGPERTEAEQIAAPWPGCFQFTGAVPYDQVPTLLAQADIGVAPFTTARHPALQAAGFFWSPLKIFEYMAAGLPVVTVNIPPLNQIVRDGHEGLLVREADDAALATTLTRLINDLATARAMGEAARTRVVAHYSWQQHCIDIEGIIEGMLHAL